MTLGSMVSSVSVDHLLIELVAGFSRIPHGVLWRLNVIFKLCLPQVSTFMRKQEINNEKKTPKTNVEFSVDVRMLQEAHEPAVFRLQV